jgi:hypothetical protein
VSEVDYVGGLTFEEFWEALVRIALVFFARRSSARPAGGGGQGKHRQAGRGADEQNKSETTIYDTIVHLLVWISDAMVRACVRACSLVRLCSALAFVFALEVALAPPLTLALACARLCMLLAFARPHTRSPTTCAGASSPRTACYPATPPGERDPARGERPGAVHVLELPVCDEQPGVFAETSHVFQKK